MKKIIYITLSTILGVLLSFLAHAIIEMPVIWLMVSNFEKYSLGLNWDQLMMIHIVFTVLLLTAGIFLGIKFGFKWWKYIYIDKKYRGRLVKIKD